MPDPAHDSPERPLADAVCWLSCTAEYFVHAMSEAQGVHPTDLRALLLLDVASNDNRMMSAGELSSALLLSSGAVTYLVERLAQAGHVSREADPQDRRRVLLRLTDDGREVVGSYGDTLDSLLGNACANLDPDQAPVVVQALSTIAQAMHGYAQEVHARR